jgi:hypothetical protein
VFASLVTNCGTAFDYRGNNTTAGEGMCNFRIFHLYIRRKNLSVKRFSVTKMAEDMRGVNRLFHIIASERTD